MPCNNKWYSVAPMPTERYKASATSWNNKVVVAGGLPLSNLRSVQQYDLQTDIWTKMPDLTEERRDFSLVNLDGVLLAIGGNSGYGNKQKSLSSVELFDEGADKWKVTSKLGYGRHAFAAAVFKVN